MPETILITGANRGIGLELSRIFAENSWQVFACCRDPESAVELKRLESDFAGLTTYALDVNDESAITRLSQGLKGEQIDILLNNAGIWGPENQAFGATNSPDWVKVLKTNVIAPLKITEAFIDHVVAGRRKIVATMGSMMGSVADNSSGGQYLYRTSKAAINMVTKSLSIDLRHQGITAVVLHPGWVQTDMGGPQAPTLPAESAAGLYQVLTNLTEADNGRFLTFEGKELSW
jgi:NAD(P)-dependent dehydrogenase (short-subunit alcohol dehydrogenase family)